MGLFETGVPTREQIEKLKPPEGRKKPIAVIECFEEIPCDPCREICKAGAIVMDKITDIPVLIPEKCTGCGKCVALCPGLAIFMVWPEKGLVWVPHEFLPIPQKGQKVLALDREGNVACEATVKTVMNARDKLETTVVCLEVPKELVMKVRAIKPGAID